MRFSRRLLTTSLSAVFAFTMLGASLTACADAPTSTAASVSVPKGAIIIDVRTPEEYAEGHLAGAQLLDLNSGQFAATLNSLDPNAEYFVYCRSGNRSSQAVAMMNAANFTHVTDLGALQTASSATGISITTD